MERQKREQPHKLLNKLAEESSISVKQEEQVANMSQLSISEIAPPVPIVKAIPEEDSANASVEPSNNNKTTGLVLLSDSNVMKIQYIIYKPELLKCKAKI